LYTFQIRIPNKKILESKHLLNLQTDKDIIFCSYLYW